MTPSDSTGQAATSDIVDKEMEHKTSLGAKKLVLRVCCLTSV